MWREDPRKGEVSHMDLLKEANRRGRGARGGVCGEKGNQVGAFWGVKRGLAEPSGREGKATCGPAEAGRWNSI